MQVLILTWVLSKAGGMI